ncbi:barstar family protein [Nocardioides sp. SYSU DS0663]|uniref:barstar family protein n=1 Tax=Nocardioides sp. SYSU DS0663 TaxID=3416445 RepID=UPI003F4C9D3D
MSDPTPLAAALTGTRWRLRHADTVADPTKAAVLEALGDALGFPDWWGRNLDALADCLGDIEAPSRTLLLWDGWAGFAADDPRGFGLVRRLLADAGLAVLLRGDGPALGGPPA